MAVLLTQLFAQLKYGVGDQISIDRQIMDFLYCYPSDSIDVEHALSENPPDTTFSFSKHENKIFILDMSATWWDPCKEKIPVGDELYKSDYKPKM